MMFFVQIRLRGSVHVDFGKGDSVGVILDELFPNGFNESTRTAPIEMRDGRIRQ